MTDKTDPIRAFLGQILAMCPSAGRYLVITQIATVVGAAISRGDDALQTVLTAVERTEGARDPDTARKEVLGLMRKLDPSHAEEAAREAADTVLRAAGARIPGPEGIQIDFDLLQRQVAQDMAEMKAWTDERRLQQEDDATVRELCDDTDDDPHPLVARLMLAIMESGREGRISAAASVLEIAREERPDESPFERFGPGESLILASCNGRWPDDARGD